MSAKQRRQGLRLSAQNAIDAIQTLQQQTTVTSQEQLQRKGILLQSFLSRIEPFDTEVLAFITDPSELEKELDSIRNFSDSLLEAIVSTQPVQPPSPHLGPPPTSFQAPAGSESHHSRLPKLEIPPFEGDPLRWQEFWDAFDAAIHIRTDLKPVDKLSYLRGLVKGEAFNLIQGFRVTDVNYDSVIGLLKQRYGDRQAVIFAHVDALLSLPPAAGDASSLLEMHTNLERHLRSLDSLQPEQDSILYSIVLSKLPRFLKIEAHRKRGAREDWTFTNLRNWLQEEIRAREMGERMHRLTCDVTEPKGNRYVVSKPSAEPRFSKPDFRRRKEPSSASSLVFDSKKAQCPYCSSTHGAEQCTRFPDTESRRAQLRNRCLSCLLRGHSAKECRRRRQCRHCSRTGHHPSLCFTKFGKPADRVETTATLNVPIFQSSSSFGVGVEKKGSLGEPVTSVAASTTEGTEGWKNERTVMQTAVIHLVNNKDSSLVKARILFDTGASRSFITAAKQKELNLLPIRKECLSVSTFQSSKRLTTEFKIVDVGIECRDGSVEQIAAAVVPTITCPIQKVPLSPANLTVPKWSLAEPIADRTEFVGIDVLIGMDYYHSFISTQRIQAGENLWFLSSKVGFVVSGRVSTDEPGPETVAVMFLRTLTAPDPASTSVVDLSKYWDLEEIGMKESQDKGSSDEEALKSFSSTVKFENGRYQVCWPWKSAERELKDNRGLAYGRLKSLLSRLAREPDVLLSYDAVFRDQLEKGIIERVEDQYTKYARYYMPHQGVFKPSHATTKVRVVFDASSKTKSSIASLNECLHRGPVFLEDLCGLLLRFRTHPRALVSDIEKAFLQIGLQIDWTSNTGQHSTVAHHLKQQDSDVARRILRDIYVDNIITDEASLGEAVHHYQESKRIFGSASMNLREWYSNSLEFTEQIPPVDCGKDTEPKVLGLRWNVKADTLRVAAIRGTIAAAAITKRSILRTLPQVFDPCGLFAPVVIRGKLLIQDLWLGKLGWDEEVSPEIRDHWVKIVLPNLSLLSSVNVPRYVGLMAAGSTQIHVFCDASIRVCAVTLYIRYTGPESEARTNLIMAKTRLAPVKQKTTIPRLELIVGVLGTRLLAFATQHLSLQFDKCFLWTDSQCVLHWIGQQQIATRFVENGVKEIRKLPNVHYRYVPTKENPADLPIRGCDTETLRVTPTWWEGPPWLRLHSNNWPEMPSIDFSKAPVSNEVLLQGPEQLSTAIKSVTAVIDLSSFSSLERILRITAYMFRFLHNVRKLPAVRSLGHLLLKEMKEAKLCWITHVQKELQLSLEKEGKSKAAINQLGLFRDENGIIRCRGRLEYADLSYDERYPVLLPTKSRFTELVVMSYHRAYMHSGIAGTLGSIRQHFWISKGRSVVKRVLRTCRLCRRYEGGPYQLPPVPPLPKFRIEETAPFMHTGLDYMGPLYVRNIDNTSSKIWISLFTCAVTRAIHLEVVGSLSAEQFMMAFRRFIAHCGVPSVIVSDNAKQFKAGASTLRKFVVNVQNSDEFQEFSLQNEIEWRFIPEMAPWVGGFYERLVGVVKSALKNSLHSRRVTLWEMQTLLAAEISLVVNSRPLTYVEDDHHSLPVSPSQLVSPMRKNTGPLMPPTSSDREWTAPHQTRLDLLVRWRTLKGIVQDFWKSWRSQYLLSLRERHVSMTQRGASTWHPNVGTVVQLKENNPRGLWTLGRIQSLHESGDGFIRSASVRTTNGRVLKRPLKLIFPLEADSRIESEKKSCPSNRFEPLTERPERLAASRARIAWRNQSESSEEEA